MRAIVGHGMIRLILAGCLVMTSWVGAAEDSMETNIEDFGEEVQDWQVRMELARVLSYQKKYAESIQEYRRILAEQPTNEVIKLELAQVLAYDDKKEEALKLLQEVSVDKLDDKNKLAAADILASTNRFDSAEKIYQDYLKKQPGDLKVRLKYAQLLSWAKKYTDSIKEFRSLVRERPDDVQLRRKYALVLIWAGEPDKARELLEKTLPQKGHEARK